ncbi:MAG: pre-peptidase C-terminal domain-containing protein, partial [Planctomycetes bacterium]|nr:pre-peptidase C-terminal domain-containing protein [Planctomycetota bacterium]
WLDSVRKRVRKQASRKRRPKARRHASDTESLEARTMLTVSTLLIGNELSIVADGDDTIAVRPNPGNATQVQVVENGVVATTVAGVSVNDILTIDIHGGSGSNAIDLSQVNSTAFPNLTSVRIDGGDGDDTITGSADIGDTIIGGDGHDSITAGAGADSIAAGDGHDTVTGGFGENTLLAGDGNDLIVGGDAADLIDGGDGDDTLSGGAGDDTIQAGNGMDVINGNNGNDSVQGDFGDDLVQGDAGDDTVIGGSGSDSVGGGDGNDVLVGNGGNDTLLGGNGDDRINGDAGQDSLAGDAGNDTLSGDLGRDTISGGDNDDVIFGGGNHDDINGDDGNDSLFGNSGQDTILGGTGQDIIDGGNGNDLIQSDDSSTLPPAAPTPLLFAVPIDGSTVIAELDPATGAEVRRFNAPEIPSGGADGLAFDGNRIYFLNGSGTDMIYEIDPISGLTLDADPITVGSGNYDGLAVLGGMVYLLDTTAIDIHVFDPSTDQIVRTIDVNGANPVVSQLSGGLSAIANPDRLVVTETGGSRVLEIDPLTGQILSSFIPSTLRGGNYLGAAVLNGEIFLGAAGSPNIDVFTRAGTFQRTIDTPYGVSALGGDELTSGIINPTSPQANDFDIQLDLVGSFSATQLGLLTQAAQRWEQVIVGDVPDVFVPGTGQVDDIVISINNLLLDGGGNTLARAGVNSLRAGSALPSTAFIEFDSSDIQNLENSGALFNVALHEIGHALGFGTVWEQQGLISGLGGPNPRFVGTNAVAEYNLRFGINETSVPVENTGGSGTRDVHWRESVLGTELMTGFINAGANPLTRLTIAQFADLGYQVDFTRADPDNSGFAVSTVGLGASTRLRNDLGPLGQFLSLGSSNSGFVPTALRQTSGQFSSEVNELGRTVVVDTTPIVVAPGLDPGKFDVTTRLGQQLMAEISSGASSFTSGSIASLVIPEIEGNNTISNAVNLDNSGFSLDFDANIGDSVANTSAAIPHISIQGTGNGTHDFFSFVVTNAGDRGIFDIDFGADPDGGFFDSELFLFDSNGNLLASNDDPVQATPTVGEGGSVSSLDSFLETTFTAPGLYVIGVASSLAQGANGGLTGGEIPSGATYTLQVSIENHATGIITTPQTPVQIPASPGDTVDGGTGNDTITGSAADDFLNGNVGNDEINAGDGQDTLFGALGDDVLNGDGGNDFIRGHSGDDTKDGGTGDDIYSWRNGDDNDSILASLGADFVELDGTNSADTWDIEGSAGVLTVALNNDVVSIDDDTAIVNVNARNGDDTFIIGDIVDVNDILLSLNAANGNDVLNASGAETTGARIAFEGGNGNDTITGTDGDETINGADGDDLINGGGGNDLIDGGAGDDRLFGDDGNDTARGSFGTDTLGGGAGDDSLDGGRSNDVLNGDEGNDSLTGGHGDDTLSGNLGMDSLSGSSGNDVLDGGDEADFVNGGTDEDLITGGDGDDTLRGGDGDDTISGGAGDDVVNGGDGDDSIDGDIGDDALNGGDGNDSILGDFGDDTIAGMDGDDMLIGAAGRDLIVGGDGDDGISGNGSTDTVAGGEGNDVFGNGIDPATEIDETFAFSAALLRLLDAQPPV